MTSLMPVMSDHLSAHARFRPGSEALYDVDNARRFTWAELRDLSLRWTATLKKHGVVRGDRVAVLAQNRGETFAVLYACAQLGATLFPINWRLAPAERQWQLEHAKPRVCIEGPEFRGHLTDGALGPVLALDVDPVDPPMTGPGAGADDPWMLLYTSGTSGRPKGALITHRQVHWNAVNTWLACDLDHSSSTLTCTPLFHTGGLNCLSTPVLAAGGRVVLTASVEPARDLELVRSEAITHLLGVPTIYEMWANHAEFEGADLGSVRDALCGGAPLSVDLLRRYLDRGLPLRQGFGMTEVGPNCFSLPHADQPRKLGSVGKTIHHVAMRIVRPDGTECDPDEPGELWMSGPAVFGGYLDDPEATAKAFDGPWFKTGDVLRRDRDGFYWVCGRQKAMFISGGENVYPAEVEAAIFQISGVAQVAVIGVHDPRWGEAGHAFVELRPGSTLTVDEIKALLEPRLARFKIPKHWTLDPDLPRTGAGKIDKQALKRRSTP
ncbi:MAG: AMP-binding protein [Myxococcota bacterium]